MSIKSKIVAVKDITLSAICRVFKKPFNILSKEQTIKKIIDENLSVSRFGDGELFIMSNANAVHNSFQDNDEWLAKRLREVAATDKKGFLLCVPDCFRGTEKFEDFAAKWYKYFKRKEHCWHKYFDEKKIYGDALITRCYMDLKDKTSSPAIFELLKKIWEGKDVLIVEGEFSRLGVGNDLFDKTKSVRRILCPPKNAYKKYDEIMQEVKKQSKDKLILLALGATATVMAYDLFNEGYRAIDIGHIDVEYEWMKMGAKTKVSVPGRYVNEAGDAGHQMLPCNDEKYLAQIVAKIAE